eukprot:6455176-Amphidinium_carterae.2
MPEALLTQNRTSLRATKDTQTHHGLVTHRMMIIQQLTTLAAVSSSRTGESTQPRRRILRLHQLYSSKVMTLECTSLSKEDVAVWLKLKRKKCSSRNHHRPVANLTKATQELPPVVPL